MDNSIIFNQMMMFAFMLAVGFAMQKSPVFSEHLVEGLGELLSKFVIPCMLLTIMPNGGNASDIMGNLNFVLWSLGYILGTLALSIFITRFLGFQDKARRNMHAMVGAFGNSAFIGAPVALSIYPGEAVASAIYTLIECVSCWSIGPVVAAPDGGFSTKGLKKMVSPITVAVVIGFLLTALNIHPAGFMPWDTLTAIGATSKYFSTFYIGMRVGQIGFRKLFAEKRIILTSLTKLIVFPLLLAVLLKASGALSPEKYVVLMIFAATPTPVSAPLIARLAGGDETYATAGTLLNTVLCIFTIPLVMKLVG